MPKFDLQLGLNIIYFIGLIILFFLYYTYNHKRLKILYTTLGGKIILVLIILFSCTINLYLALIVILLIIFAKPIFVSEGLENKDNIDKDMSIIKRPIDNSIDKESVRNSIIPVSSNSLPIISGTKSSEYVEAFTNSNTLLNANIFNNY
jgi:hypothetical protein